MVTLVIYDVVDDRVRAKIADAFLDYGLTRIQYSAFMGELTQNRSQELILRIRKLLAGNEGQAQCIPVCDKDLRRRTIVGTSPVGA